MKNIIKMIEELENKLNILYQNEKENSDIICEIEEELNGLKWDYDSRIF